MGVISLKGICAAEVRPRIPTPICIWRELVWISSLAHVSKIHDLINLMSPPPPPPPSLKENTCWPPPNLRLISSKSAALQCPVVQVYQRSLGTSCNITTHVDNRAPLTSTSVKQAEPVRKRIPPTIPPHT
ncbi:hypothetical protein EMCRGX_G029809 [Ephydatia muelleri]